MPGQTHRTEGYCRLHPPAIPAPMVAGPDGLASGGVRPVPLVARCDGKGAQASSLGASVGRPPRGPPGPRPRPRCSRLSPSSSRRSEGGPCRSRSGAPSRPMPGRPERPMPGPPKRPRPMPGPPNPPNGGRPISGRSRSPSGRLPSGCLPSGRLASGFGASWPRPANGGRPRPRSGWPGLGARSGRPRRDMPSGRPLCGPPRCMSLRPRSDP